MFGASFVYQHRREGRREDVRMASRAMKVDAAPWGANEVYRRYYRDGEPMDRYLLCFDDRIVDFQPDWEMTPEQMAIAGELLKQAELN